MQEAGKGSNQTYFDQSNKLDMESNPAVKAAFDETVKMSQAGLAAEAFQFLSDPWSQGLKKDAFATVACPAWMLGLIKHYEGAERRASGTSPSCPVAAATGAAPGWPSPRRASTRRRPPSS